jgi:hypothetical protein
MLSGEFNTPPARRRGKDQLDGWQSAVHSVLFEVFVLRYRGYEGIVEKLKGVGADIEQVHGTGV